MLVLVGAARMPGLFSKCAGQVFVAIMYYRLKKFVFVHLYVSDERIAIASVLTVMHMYCLSRIFTDNIEASAMHQVPCALVFHGIDTRGDRFIE